MRIGAAAAFLSLVMLCSGCGMVEDNSEIIKEYKACKDAGMAAVQTGDGQVHCAVPEREAK